MCACYTYYEFMIHIDEYMHMYIYICVYEKEGERERFRDQDTKGGRARDSFLSSLKNLQDREKQAEA